MVVYVLVDDYLKASAHAGHSSLPQADNQKGSYAELMTIALVGELRTQSHVGNWFEFVKVEYAALFPRLPHRTRYYRVLKRLERVWADFALRFAAAEQNVTPADARALQRRWDRVIGLRTLGCVLAVAGLALAALSLP